MKSSKGSVVGAILTLALVASLFTAAAGFWLSWGSESFQNPGDPILRPGAIQYTLSYTGKDAPFYGWSQLLIGAVGGTLGLLAMGLLLLRRDGPWRSVIGSCVAAAFAGLLLHVVLRMDARVTMFGSVGYALSQGDFTLGYTIGPALGIIGFVAGAILGFAALRLGPPRVVRT